MEINKSEDERPVIETQEYTSFRWAVGVTTAPRPTSTLDRTLASLKRTGWDDVRVFEDQDGVGAWPNWLRMMDALVREHADTDALLVCQDDAVFCRDLRDYLERTLWPSDNVALCSPYCPGAFRSKAAGWRHKKLGWNLVGAACWAMPYDAAKAAYDDLKGVKDTKRVDAHVGKCAAATGRDIYFHTPSLVQHVGDGNSAIGRPTSKYWRTASDFVGEDANP